MNEPKIIDHLFRHQYGKMVSILTRIFGFAHIETIEDAVQDTFIAASQTWRNGLPDNPEAWLTAAAKNRALDLFRKLKAEKARIPNIENGTAAIALNELFLDSNIADSQLRMIFMACHPSLNPKDQIAFALKAISGFSQKEIGAALLLKEDTVKKRLSRARNSIQAENIKFEIPHGKELAARLPRVLEVIYLIFNEGFHSTKREFLIREDLCGEALRLCKMLLANKHTNTPDSNALFALCCFQSSRLRSKVNEHGEVLSLSQQDRSLWYKPLINLGNAAMHRAVETNQFSLYHFEAAIAYEHVKAASFEDTNWDSILNWYQELQHIQPSIFNELNMAVVQLQRKDYKAAKLLLKRIKPKQLEQRAYLYHGTWAEYYPKSADLTLNNVNLFF